MNEAEAGRRDSKEQIDKGQRAVAGGEAVKETKTDVDINLLLTLTKLLLILVL